MKYNSEDKNNIKKHQSNNMSLKTQNEDEYDDVINSFDFQDHLDKHLETVNSSRKKHLENHVVELGNSGDEVEVIQKYLKKLDYPINIDGHYGEETRKYIMDFQFKANLLVDGRVGRNTLEKLKNTKDPKLKYHKPEPSKSLSAKEKSNSNKSNPENNNLEVNNQCFCSTTPYFIFVDLKSHKVNIFTGECKNWKLIKSFTCTTGAPSTPTIKGNYKLNLKGKELKLDYCVVKYYSQINGNYLFHSILYDFNGKVMDSRVGYSLSHGCIRLKTEDAKYIYDVIPKETTIHIQ